MTGTGARSEIAWQRLSPRMLLVHPVHELLRQLPLLIGGVVLGSTTGNQSWTVAVLGLTVVVGVARWFTTSYRIDDDPQSGQVQLRVGLLHRKVLSVPRNRIRSVQSDARLLHRMLGLAVRYASSKPSALDQSTTCWICLDMSSSISSIVASAVATGSARASARASRVAGARS